MNIEKIKRNKRIITAVILLMALFLPIINVYAMNYNQEEQICYLDLEKEKLSDIPEPNKLKKLYIENYQDENLNVLPDMKELKTLYIINKFSEGKITNLNGIEKFENIEELSLINQKLYDLEGIDKLKNLSYINFSNNNIRDLRILKNLKKLKSVDYSFNPIEKGLDEIQSLNDKYPIFFPRSVQIKKDNKKNKMEITMPIVNSDEGKALRLVPSDTKDVVFGRKGTDPYKIHLPNLEHMIGHHINIEIVDNKVYLDDLDYSSFKSFGSFPLLMYVDDNKMFYAYGIVDFPNTTVKTEDKATDTDDLAVPKDVGVGEDSINDKSTQTKEQANLSEVDKLKKEVEDLTKKLDENKELSDKQKEEIKQLNEKLKNLKDKTSSKDTSEDVKNKVSELEKKYQALEDKVNKSSNSNKGSSVSDMPKTGTSGQSGSISKLPLASAGKDMSKSSTDLSKSIEGKQPNEDKSIRYPNKLTPKQPANRTQNMSSDGQSQNLNTNKGVASAPSKARGTVTENKDNGNKDYPVHHGDEKDTLSKDMYSADARQFVTFTTKNGKTFHLIINHDEDSENVLLLTEVSEDDLLNMVEKKEAPKEVVKEEPVKKEEKPEKKEGSSNFGTYLLLFLVIAGALGAGYYFKVIKKKEEKELENFEEDEDDEFFTEVVDLDETEDVKESELEEADDK